MFTEDIFAFYQGTARFGHGDAGADRTSVRRARHGRCLRDRAAAFRSRFSTWPRNTRSPAMPPLRRCWWPRCSGGTAPDGARWRAPLWTAAAVAAVAVFQTLIPAPPPGSEVAVWSIGGTNVITRGAAGTVRARLAAGRADDAHLGAADDCRLAGDTEPRRRATATLARYFSTEMNRLMTTPCARRPR